jgi:poly-gamma-glutamate capsule biosynthesis protein CapA/YwtB (metallophosphatase superfamily)
MDAVRLFLSGDVMTGRGIDQVLPYAGDPTLFESHVRDARTYVELAEQVNGPIARGAPFTHPWGDALIELDRVAPHARLINLETAITTHDTPWPNKAVHYRMHPANAPVIDAARIDCSVLANNHVMDWGHGGLLETLDALRDSCRTCGAGRSLTEARAPAIIDVGGAHRLLVFGCGSGSSGIPPQWSAAEDRPGVWRVDERDTSHANALAREAARHRRPGDLVVVSIHWGGNWGYAIPAEQRNFAHRLLDSGAVDLVHGHSSHHAKAFEVHAGKLILYGCGDLLNDYEGIEGGAFFRGELSLMYFPRLDATTGELLELRLVPMRMRQFQLVRASRDERHWLRDTLHRECAPGVQIEHAKAGTLRARWG